MYIYIRKNEPTAEFKSIISKASRAKIIDLLPTMKVQTVILFHI